MKKLILTLLITVLSHSAFAQVLFNEDFSSGDFSKWNTVNQGGGSMTVVNGEALISDTLTTGKNVLMKKFSSVNTRLKAQFSFSADYNNNKNTYIYLKNGSKNVCRLRIYKGNLQIKNAGSGWTKISGYQLNTWHTVKVDVNLTTRQCSVQLDSKSPKKNLPLEGVETAINRIQIETHKKNSGYSVKFDNILIEKDTFDHTLTFTAGTGGSISGNDTQTLINGENALAVEAVADSGYTFVQWSDGNTDNPRTLTNVTSNINLTAEFQADSSQLFLSQDFTFDDLNRRDTVTLADGSIWDYNYDGLGNLEQAHKAHPSDPAQDLLFNYTYDDIGNRKTANENGVSISYKRNRIQQYTEVNKEGTIQNLTYDDAGNPDVFKDWNLTWDGEDRLKTMTNSISGEKLEFGYDYRGFRGWKKVYADGSNISEWIGYVYDGNLVTEEIDLLDPNKKIIRSYTWGLDPAGTKQQVGGIGALVSMEETQADNSVKTFHVVSDAGGNVTNLVESHADGSLTMANTYEYGPFGQVIAKTEAVEMPYQFNTKYTDSETGLVYYGFRFYDSADGRWLNRDPIGAEGGINIYNSVSNNMVNGYSGGLKWTAGMGRKVGLLGELMGLDAFGHYEIDVHRFLTEFLAKAVGFGGPYAEVLGVETQKLDAPGDNRDAMHGGVSPANMKSFHFVSKGQLANLRKIAFKKGATDRSIGEYLHALQDTYAHTKGKYNRDWDYHGGEDGGWTGHGASGHKPDQTWHFPTKGMEMAIVVYYELLCLKRRKGVKGEITPFREVRAKVQRFMQYEPKQYIQYYFKTIPVKNATFEGYLKKIRILNPRYFLPDYSRDVQSSGKPDVVTEVIKKTVTEPLKKKLLDILILH